MLSRPAASDRLQGDAGGCALKTTVHESGRDIQGSGYQTSQKDSLIELRSLRSLQRNLR